MNLFETKISYDRISERGAVETVTEYYVFEAETFGDAENKVIEIAEPSIKMGYEVKSVKRAKIAELFFYPESEKWFKARINFLYIDETGKEKKVGVTALVQSGNMKDARERIEERMKECMADYEIVKIEETQILDVVIESKN